jgi:hypothetical protein
VDCAKGVQVDGDDFKLWCWERTSVGHRRNPPTLNPKNIQTRDDIYEEHVFSVDFRRCIDLC